MTTGKFEVVQGGEVVAKTQGPFYNARRDAMHYGLMYLQEGRPVLIRDVSKRNRRAVVRTATRDKRRKP